MEVLSRKEKDSKVFAVFRKFDTRCRRIGQAETIAGNLCKTVV